MLLFTANCDCSRRGSAATEALGATATPPLVRDLQHTASKTADAMPAYPRKDLDTTSSAYARRRRACRGLAVSLRVVISCRYLLLCLFPTVTVTTSGLVAIICRLTNASTRARRGALSVAYVFSRTLRAAAGSSCAFPSVSRRSPGTTLFSEALACGACAGGVLLLLPPPALSPGKFSVVMSPCEVQEKIERADNVGKASELGMGRRGRG